MVMTLYLVPPGRAPRGFPNRSSPSPFQALRSLDEAYSLFLERGKVETCPKYCQSVMTATTLEEYTAGCSVS
jgi:hypothetical protein